MKYSEKLKDPRWQRMRLTVMQHDDFTCQSCGDTKTELHIHHLKYAKRGNPWDVDCDDLITLCAICHNDIESFISHIRKTIHTKSEVSAILHFLETYYLTPIEDEGRLILLLIKMGMKPELIKIFLELAD